MGAIRQIAVRRGLLPPGMKASVDQLEKFGRLTEVSEFENKVRAKKNIPELKVVIPEVKEILTKLGTRKAIEGGSSDE